MSDFNFKLNPTSGAFEAQFQAKLISLGTTVMTNKNGTEYVVGSIQFPNSDGQLVTRSAICYKANADKGLVIGETYISTAVMTADQPTTPLLLISPLTGAVRATSEDFGDITFEALSVKADVGAEQVA